MVHRITVECVRGDQLKVRANNGINMKKRVWVSVKFWEYFYENKQFDYLKPFILPLRRMWILTFPQLEDLAIITKRARLSQTLWSMQKNLFAKMPAHLNVAYVLFLSTTRNGYVNSFCCIQHFILPKKKKWNAKIYIRIEFSFIGIWVCVVSQSLIAIAS